jgi:hypothetical protein
MNKGYALLLLAVMTQAGSLWVSVDKTNFDYAETRNDGSLLDTEKNRNLLGVSMGIEPKEGKGWYAKTRFAGGDTDYAGSVIGGSGVYGSYKGISHNVVSDSTLGYATNMTPNTPVNLTLPIRWGIGYRGWHRYLNAYSEYYDWGYATIGTGVHFSPNNRLNLGIDVDYQKAFFAGMSETLHGYHFDLKNVYGYSITAPLSYALNDHYSFIAQYRYEMWNINHSETIGGFYEPDSRTKNQVISVGVLYRY